MKTLRVMFAVTLIGLAVKEGVKGCDCPGWNREAGVFTLNVGGSTNAETGCCTGDPSVCYMCVTYRATFVGVGINHEGPPACNCADMTLGTVEKMCCGWGYNGKKRVFVGCNVEVERDAIIRWLGPGQSQCFSEWSAPRTSGDCGLSYLVDC